MAKYCVYPAGYKKSSKFLGWAVVLKKMWVPIRTILFKVRLFSVCKVVHALRRQSFN